MNDFEFQAQVKRISALRPRVWDAAEEGHRRIYTEELWRRFHNATQHRFARVVSRVIDTHAGHDLPIMYDFIQADRAIGERESKEAEEVARKAPVVYSAEESRAMLTEMEQEAVRLTPRGALVVLVYEKNAKVKLPASVRSIVREIAAQDPKAKSFMDIVIDNKHAETDSEFVRRRDESVTKLVEKNPQFAERVALARKRMEATWVDGRMVDA